MIKKAANAVMFFLLPITVQVQAETKPLQVLYVTGGGYHDYTNQEIILRDGLSKRANINWTTWKGNKTKAGVPELYLAKDWAAGFDVVIHNGCMGDISETGAERNGHANRQRASRGSLRCGGNPLCHAHLSQGQIW